MPVIHGENEYFRQRDEKLYPIRRDDKLESGRIYRTRGGERVRVYSIENNEIHGAINHHGVWEIDTWNLDGSYYAGKGKAHGRDILLAPALVIKPNSKYKSRDGRPIKIYEINHGSKDFPVVGSIKDDNNQWVPRVWNDKGITKIPYGPNNDIVSEWSET